MMIVSDPGASKVLASVPIGAGDDGVAFRRWICIRSQRPGRNDHDGGPKRRRGNSGWWLIPTQRSARTIAADQRAHKLYLPAAEYAAAAQSGANKGRPTPLPDRFRFWSRPAEVNSPATPAIFTRMEAGARRASARLERAFDEGPSRNLYITAAARHYFRRASIHVSASKADARDVSDRTPVVEAPRLVIHVLGTLDRRFCCTLEIGIRPSRDGTDPCEACVRIRCR